MFSKECVVLPVTAVPVKVTNMISPYIMRICEIKSHKEKAEAISKQLMVLTRGRILKNKKVPNPVEPKVGNRVVVHSGLDRDIDLPAWWCRGVLCNVDPVNEKYNTLLTDYGNCVELQKCDFTVIPSDLISDEYLSTSVGVYNIIPSRLEQEPTRKIAIARVVKEWSESAIQFTKELLSVSDAVYFDHLVSDDCGRKYGEFYINIDDEIIRLSEALVCNSYAVHLEPELSKFLLNPKKEEEGVKERINNETVFYVDISKQKDNKEIVTPDKQNGYKTNLCEIQKQRLPSMQLESKRQKVLIYSKVKCEILTSVLDARFPTKIHRAWKNLVQSTRPKRIQSYIWPAIKKGLDVVVVGPSQSGKTCGSTVAVAALLAENENLPKGANPSALVLCSSSSKVHQVHSLFVELLQGFRSIRSVSAISGQSERSIVAEMFNGCQILVSTPKFLVEFLNRNKQVLKFENLQHLLLDEADIIWDKYLDYARELFFKHKIMRNKKPKSNDTPILQIIMTAKHWTPKISIMVDTETNNPYICFASFTEAVIFKSIRPKVYVTNSNSKNKTILDLLDDEYAKSRTMIVCMNAEEAQELNAFLSVHKETVLSHENMSFVELQGIKQCWEACVTGSFPILISTDEILSDMDITNITWLIHFAISLPSKTQFNFRLSTLFNSLQMAESVCKITIMIDETNDVQFQSIMRTMQRMRVKMSKDLLKNIERISITLDKQKQNYDLCDSVKSFGFCPKRNSCAFRHCVLSDVDSPTTPIEPKDKVKFMVLCVHDASHVSARIMSYVKSKTSEEIQFSSAEHMSVCLKIQQYYSLLENRRKCTAIDVGDICGFEETIDDFKRVQVLLVHNDERDSLSHQKLVDVRCVDSGYILTKVHMHRLLYLPEELTKLPTEIVEVFLTGIAPNDDENVWNKYSVDAVFQWFQEYVDKRSYLIGTVNLHLGNTMWVDTLQIGTKLIGYDDVIGTSLKVDLLENNHAVLNDKHLPQLHKLCADAGLNEIKGCDTNSTNIVTDE